MPIAFGLWRWLIRAVGPCSVALIILIKSRFVVHDGDESKVRVWDRKAIWLQEFIAFIIPFMEAMFVLFPVADKSMMIFHNIVSFMAINIHPISHLPILPAKSS